jgi:nicotinamide mononucleotide transporter
MPRRLALVLASLACGCITLWAVAVHATASRIDWVPEPDLLWRDATSTVLNYFAQFLQGARRMECWVAWLAVNLLGIHIYTVKGLPVYAVQYAFFLALGLYGWWCWQKKLTAAAADHAAAGR